MKRAMCVILACLIAMAVFAGCDLFSPKPGNESQPESSALESSQPESSEESSGGNGGGETSAPESSEPFPASSAAEPESSGASSETPDSTIAKITGGADEVGIYSVVVRLTEQAADKGVVEMVYYGAKGSPQENSIVNTFRIEYYKESAGTYEISTFFDGELYQNQHHKDEVKVVNTFDATLRAGDVAITYTPDGGETLEIFRADAEYFR